MPIIDPTHFDIYQYEEDEFKDFVASQPDLDPLEVPTTEAERLFNIEQTALRKKLFFDNITENPAFADEHHVARINTKAHYNCMREHQGAGASRWPGVLRNESARDLPFIA